MPYCYDLNVNVHNNLITANSIGDELFSGTPAGSGGVTFCTGSDYYKFDYNWVCGNMSTGDGGGFAHVGFTFDGDIEHNTIIFNQSLLVEFIKPGLSPPCVWPIRKPRNPDHPGCGFYTLEDENWNSFELDLTPLFLGPITDSRRVR